jgi:PAS domain S-box-containing protein
VSPSQPRPSPSRRAKTAPTAPNGAATTADDLGRCQGTAAAPLAGATLVAAHRTGRLVVRHDWTIAELDDEAARLLGRPADALRGGDLFARCPELVGTPFAERCRAALADGRASTFVVASPTGNLRIEVQAEPVPDGLAVRLTDLGQATIQDAASPLDAEILGDLVERVPDAVYVKDLAGRYVFVNPGVEAQLGRPRHEIVGRTDHDLFPAALADAYVANDRRALEAGAAVATTATADSPDGPLVFRSVKFPLRDTAGDVVGLAGVSTDVTAWQRTETALAESEARYQSLFDGAADAILVAELDGRLRNANLAASRLLGYERDDLLARRIADLVAGDPVWLAAEFARFLEAGVWQGEHQVRRRDDALVPVESSARIVQTPTGPVQWLALRDVSARREAEDALRRSEERYRSLVDAMTVVVWTTDADGRFAEPQPSWVAYTGQPWPDHAGWGWLEMIHPADRAAVRGQAAKALAGPSSYSSQGRIWHAASGRFRRYEARAVPIHDATGTLREWIGTVTDVEERERAEDGLRLLAEAGATFAASLDYSATLEHVARLVVPALADYALIYAVDGHRLRREAFAHIDPGKVALLRELERLYQPALDDPHSLPARVVRSGAPLLVEQIDPAMDEAITAGNPRLASVVQALGASSAIVVPLPARGNVLGAVLLCAAESGRRYGRGDLALAEEIARRAALALDNARLFQQAQEAEARYRGLFEALPDGVLVAAGDGRYQEVNPAAAAALGYEREELIGMTHADVSAASAWADAEYQRFLQTGQWRGEVELRRKDGSILPVDAWVRRVELPSGPVSIGTMRDVSDRKALERLQQSFLGSVSHDLKNPLAVIKGQAQYLRRQLRREATPDPEKQERGLAAIEETVGRTTDLIQELIDVARLQGGQELQLERQVVDLVALARAAAEAYKRTTERHVLRVEAAEPSLVGMFDGRRLERVIGNLLTNAIKYSPRGGEITIRLTREPFAGGDWAVLAVTDRGVGIPAADLPHVFERYRRGANVGAIAGTGIGLSGVRQIVEQHGGAIGVQSRQGLGSTFTVQLPVRPSARSDTGAASS